MLLPIRGAAAATNHISRAAAAPLRVRHLLLPLALVYLTACAAADRAVAPSDIVNVGADVRLATITRLLVSPPPAALAAGTTFTCQLRSNTRWCWGTNSFTQIGDGTSTNRLSAIRILGRSWSAVASGNEFGCALTTGDAVVPAGTAFCWGTNRLGQLGTGTGASATVPTRVAGTTVFTQLAAAAEGVCALDGAGATWCWGQGAAGAGGVSPTTPTRLTSAPVFAALYAGPNKFCGLTSAGQAYCWGLNTRGSLAMPLTVTGTTTPTAVGGTLRFSQLSLAAEHACGLDANARAWCWGSDDYGQIGSSTIDGAWVPKSVNLNYSYKRLALTNTVSCGVRSDNVTLCWGTGAALGTSKKGTFRTPQPTVGGLAFETLSANRYHVCGTVAATVQQPQPAAYCWGENFFGVLGTGDLVNRAVPTAVTYSTITVQLAP